MAEGRITGEALYALLLAADPGLAYTWRDLPPYDKDAYVEVATALNGTYLAPLQGAVQAMEVELGIVKDACRATFEKQVATIQALQGLVMQWRQLLQEHDELSTMSVIEIDDWHRHWELLKRRSSAALGEEQKEG